MNNFIAAASSAGNLAIFVSSVKGFVAVSLISAVLNAVLTSN